MKNTRLDFFLYSAKIRLFSGNVFSNTFFKGVLLKIATALILFFSLSKHIYAQDTLCVGIECRPIEVHGASSPSEAGSQLGDLGSYTSSAKNRYSARSRPSHQEVVEKAKLTGEAQQNFRPQMESSSSLKLYDLKLGMCLINPKDQSAFYKIVELDKNSGLIRYVKENEVHNNELKAKIVFFHQSEANDLKAMKVWPCENTPNLSDAEYVRGCTKVITASGVHFCNSRSQISGRILE